MNPFRRFALIATACTMLATLFLVAGESRAFVLLGTTDYNGPGGFPCDDYANSLAIDGGGNIFVAGSERGSSGGGNWRIRKYDATLGTLLATTDYNGPGNSGDAAYSVAIDGSGNVVVAGYEIGSSGGYNWRIRKYDATLGTLLATTDYNGPANNSDEARAIAIDVSGNVVVAGYEYGSSGYYDWRIRKYDATLGTLLATTDYNGPGNGKDEAYSLAIDVSGNVVVAGCEYGSSGGLNWRISKYDATLGTLLATTDYNGPGNKDDEAYSLAIDVSGNVVVAGYEMGSSGWDNWRIRKYDATLGTLLATMDYSTPGDEYDHAYSVAIDGSGNVFVAGYEWEDILGNWYWCINKYDAGLGTLLATVEYSGTLIDGSEAHSLVLDGSGNAVVAGYEWSLSGSRYNWRINRYGPSSSANLDVSLSLSPSAINPGQGTKVFLTVTNWGDAAVTNLIPELEINWGSALVSLVSGPVPSSSNYLGPGKVTTFTWIYNTVGTGTVGFTGTVTGFDLGLSATIFDAASATLLIQEPAAVEAALVAWPLASPLYAGDAVMVTLTVTNTGEASAIMRATATPWVSGAVSAARATGPLPSPTRTITGGTSQTFTWVFTVTGGSGTLSFSASADGRDANSGAPLATGFKTAGPVTVSVLQTACPMQSMWEKIFDRNQHDDRSWGIAVSPTGEPYLAEQEDQYLFGQYFNFRVAGYSAATGALFMSDIYNSPTSGNDIAYGIALAPSGSIYAAGKADGTFLVMAVDAGYTLWTREITPSATPAEGHGVAVDSSGNILVTGIVTQPAQGADLVLIKYAPDGTTQWTYWYNSPASSDDGGYAVAVDSSGNSYVAGFENRPDLSQGHNILLQKIDPSGGLVWSRDYSSPGNQSDEARGVAVDSAGNVYVAGFETRPDLGQGSNGFLRKYDSAGTALWTKTFNGPLVRANGPSDMAYAVAVSPLGWIYVAGQQETPASTKADIMIRRYDANGNLKELFMENGAANGIDGVTGIAFNPEGDVYATGWINKSFSQGEDVWMRRFAAPVCLRASLAVTPATASNGQQLTVVMTVTNTGGNLIDNISPGLAVGPGGGIVSLAGGPSPAPPATLNPGNSTSFTWTFATSGAGPVVFTATAMGQDAVTLDWMQAVASATAMVQGAAALEGHLAAPLLACDGSVVTVTLTVTNTGEAAALDISATVFVSGTPTAEFVSGPGPLTILAGGDSATLSWTFTLGGSGLLTFSGQAWGFDANSLNSVTTGVVMATAIDVGNPAKLAPSLALSTTSMLIGEWLILDLTVTNNGSGDASGVVPSIAVSPAGAPVELILGPTPPGPVTVATGASQTFSWTWSSSGGGRVIFTASASGADFCKPVVVSATAAVDAGTSAFIEASPLTLSPNPVCRGGQVRAVLTVTNTGQVAAYSVLGTNLFTEGSATLVTPPAVIPSLAPGASANLTWVYSPTSAGTLKFTASVTAVDSRSGEPLLAGPSPSNQVTVMLPGTLAGAVAGPFLGVVNQQVTLTLTVTNTGDDTVSAVAPSATVAPARATLVSGPPGGPLPLAPSASRTYSWIWLVTGQGAIAFTMSAQGTTCGGGPVSARLTRTMTGMGPARLDIVSLVLAPNPVQLGLPVGATLVLRNSGGAPLTVTEVNPTSSSGNLSAPVSFGLLSPLAPGASMTVTWSSPTLGFCGTAHESVVVYGVEGLTGGTMWTGPTDSNPVVVAGPPSAVTLNASADKANVNSAVTLTARVTDICGLGVPAYPVDFSVLAGGGGLSSARPVTDSSGYARTTLTLGPDPGMNSAQAMLTALLISASATVEGVNPLGLKEPGAALNANAFNPDKGEIMLARIFPKNSEPISIKVFTASGRMVRYLKLSEPMGKGQYLVKWNGRNEEGERVARGVYIVYVNGGGLKTLLKVVVK